MKSMAERLRSWTQDPGVWGSIPATSVMGKNLGQALNPHCLLPPSSNGYLVHRFNVESTVAAAFALTSLGGKIKSDEYYIVF